MELKKFLRYACLVSEPQMGNRNSKYAIWRGTQLNINSINSIIDVANSVGVESFRIGSETINVNDLGKKYAKNFPNIEFNPLYNYYNLHVNPKTISERLFNEVPQKDKYTLVIGAGVSMSLGVPDWRKLLNHLALQFLSIEFDKTALKLNRASRVNIHFNKENFSKLDAVRYARVIRESQKNGGLVSKDFEIEIARTIYEKIKEYTNQASDTKQISATTLNSVINFIKYNRRFAILSG